jgi:hypothetical protein
MSKKLSAFEFAVQGKALLRTRANTLLTHRVHDSKRGRCLVSRPGTTRAQKFWVPVGRLAPMSAAA